MPNANKILIVDDDPDIHHLLAAALKDGNYLIEDSMMASKRSPSSKLNRVTWSSQTCECRDSTASNCFAEFMSYDRVQRSL